MPRSLRFVLVLSVLATSPLRAQLPDTRVPDLIRRMTVDEKFWQLFMLPGQPGTPGEEYRHGVFGLQIPPAGTARADAQRINDAQRHVVSQTRLGIPMIPFEEAVHGLRRPGATMFPQAIALAATWDTALMSRVATAIAKEARTRGIRQVLAPVVNLATDVRWGRVEETYGEDPLLAAHMARAYVAPFTRAGVITTPKHFVANVGEGGRDSWPIALDDRTLAMLHYPPFQAALAAGALSVMTAYNSVGGLPATQNHRLLSGMLKGEWGFRGFVISDASATGGSTVLHRTDPDTPTATQHAFAAGLDVVFQSGWAEHRPYLGAFQRGLIPEDVLDSSLARVLLAKEGLGLFETPFVDPDSAAVWNGHPTHLALAREAAAAALVLLHNPRGRLPLDPGLGTVAVIGPDAVEARLGGYSAPGVAPVSILDALRTRLGDRVRHAPGPGRATREYESVPPGHLDLTTAFFETPTLEGTPIETRPDSLIDARWTFNSPVRGLSSDWYGVRWSGHLTVGADTVFRLGVEGTDGWRLFLGDTLLLDHSHKRAWGVGLAPVHLPPGSRHALRLEYAHTTGNARVRLVWDTGHGNDWRALMDSATALARRSDVALVVAGIEEGEFRDRARLGLPGHQEELIRTVAATGTPTVVILIGGSAITMPWLDDVDAVLHAWYPGEAGGRAVADVLLGDDNPSGRLPITFPRAEGQLPLVYNHHPTGRGDDYVDLTGEPLFPFGYGLSYTTFAYSDLRLTPNPISPDGSTLVEFQVTNPGTRAGAEIAQLYVRDILASVTQPVLALKGFQKVVLQPGESRTLTFSLGPDELSLLGEDLRRVVEPGRFHVYVGASSRDIRLRGLLDVR